MPRPPAPRAGRLAGGGTRLDALGDGPAVSSSRRSLGHDPGRPRALADGLPERRPGLVQSDLDQHGDGVLGRAARRAGLNRPVPEVAAAVYDVVYRGNGNWPFNTAYAGQHGLVGYVSRMSSLAQVERWIEAGVPVVASLAWSPGELAQRRRPLDGRPPAGDRRVHARRRRGGERSGGGPAPGPLGAAGLPARRPWNGSG